MPNVVHPGNGYGEGWRIHHYGMPGHRRDADDDVVFYEEMRDAPDLTRMPSGELVAALLDGMVTDHARELPVNLPNAGNVTNLADGAVVEIMGVADATGVRGRDTTTVPGIMGEYLARMYQRPIERPTYAVRSETLGRDGIQTVNALDVTEEPSHARATPAGSRTRPQDPTIGVACERAASRSAPGERRRVGGRWHRGSSSSAEAATSGFCCSSTS
jgi:hypothetical protein